MHRSPFAATRPLAALAVVLASFAGPAVPARIAGAADAPLHLGELSLRLPDETWSQLSAPPDERTVEMEKEANLREDYLRVHLDFADPLHTRAEATASQLDAAEKASDKDFKSSDYRRGERTIDGRTYGTLSFHGVPANGSASPVADTVVLVWTPPDFESRHMYYTVSWEDLHSASVGPVDLSDLDALVRGFDLPPLGTTLLRDDFQDGGASVFSLNTLEHYTFGVADGELAIQNTDPELRSGVMLRATGVRAANVLVTVDVRTATGGPGQLAQVSCRTTYIPATGWLTGYRVWVDLSSSMLAVDRMDSESNLTLVPWRPLGSVLAAGDPVHIALACVGDRITVSVNGDPGISVRDTRYVLGEARIGAAGLVDMSGLFDVRFSNFEVKQA